MARYQYKPNVVEAIKLAENMNISGKRGLQYGNVGDWFVTDEFGNQSFVRDADFYKRFQLLDADIVPPTVSGPTSPTSNTTPTWTWSSGGGRTAYRYQLNGEELDGWTLTIDESFTPEAALPLGTHTLYVQEQDAFGNWSVAGSYELEIE